MADGSTIEWTDATWQPITGCGIVSPGCTNCYAMKLAGTRLRHHPSRQGLTIDSKAGPVWNGEVRFNEQWLMQPLAWRKPRKVFVCAHGDLFHESIPDEWIDKVFAVMAQCPQHTFQVLTKRAKRMRTYFHLTSCRPSRYSSLHPLPNVWLGVSTERQQEADERIPELLQTRAAVRFISAEPLLGPIDLTRIRMHLGGERFVTRNALHACASSNGSIPEHRLDWVIVGGESGNQARSMHPAWARSLRDQCAAAGVSFFFKQWGEWAPSTPEQAAGNPRSGWMANKAHPHVAKAHELYPEAGAEFVENVGKHKAGRMLDGIEHNAMPEIAR